MDSLVSWKRRRDFFQESDNVSGCGDQIEDFSEQGDVSLCGNPMGVKFIRKDETNAENLRKLKFKGWGQSKKGANQWW